MAQLYTSAFEVSSRVIFFLWHFVLWAIMRGHLDLITSKYNNIRKTFNVPFAPSLNLGVSSSAFRQMVIAFSQSKQHSRLSFLLPTETLYGLAKPPPSILWLEVKEYLTKNLLLFLLTTETCKCQEINSKREAGSQGVNGSISNFGRLVRSSGTC